MCLLMIYIETEGIDFEFSKTVRLERFNVCNTAMVFFSHKTKESILLLPQEVFI